MERIRSWEQLVFESRGGDLSDGPFRESIGYLGPVDTPEKRVFMAYNEEEWELIEKFCAQIEIAVTKGLSRDGIFCESDAADKLSQEGKIKGKPIPITEAEDAVHFPTLIKEIKREMW